MVKRILLAGFSICGGSPGATTPLPPQCNPARQAFYVMRNRNFLLQKNTACQAVFTALTSGIKLLNIVISNKLIGLFVVVVVDGIHLIQQGFPVQSAAGAQGFQRIVIISKLGIYITKQNHRIFCGIWTGVLLYSNAPRMHTEIMHRMISRRNYGFSDEL